jgi:hypothetical protein
MAPQSRLAWGAAVLALTGPVLALAGGLAGALDCATTADVAITFSAAAQQFPQVVGGQRIGAAAGAQGYAPAGPHRHRQRRSAHKTSLDAAMHTLPCPRLCHARAARRSAPAPTAARAAPQRRACAGGRAGVAVALRAPHALPLAAAPPRRLRPAMQTRAGATRLRLGHYTVAAHTSNCAAAAGRMRSQRRARLPTPSRRWTTRRWTT